MRDLTSLIGLCLLSKSPSLVRILVVDTSTIPGFDQTLEAIEIAR